MFGSSKYQCLACGQKFVIRDSKRAISQCSHCLTLVDQREPRPVVEGGPVQLIHVFETMEWHAADKIEQDRHTVEPLGWRIRHTYHCALMLGSKRAGWPVLTVIYTRDSPQVGLSQSATEQVNEFEQRRTYGYTYEGEKKFRRDIGDFAMNGLVVESLSLNAGGSLVHAWLIPAKNLKEGLFWH